MNTRKLLSQCASVPYLSSRWIAKIDWGQREYDSMSSEGGTRITLAQAQRVQPEANQGKLL